MNVQRCRQLWQRLLVSLLLALGLAAGVQAEDRPAYAFTVTDGRITLKDGVYLLSASVDFRLSPAAQNALVSGVPLTFEFQIELERSRGWWFNDGIASLSQRYRIRYHALSRRYLLTNLNSGESRGFASSEAVLEALGSVEALPVIDANLLDKDARYEVWLRARLDIDDLPAPLKTVAYMSPEWRLVSEWKKWQLVP